MKSIGGISLDHKAWKIWRKKNEARYQKWANTKYTCPDCGKHGIPNKRKARHQKSKKCMRARGLDAPRKQHKTRADKGKSRE